jgi:hypothetical protein
MKQSAIKWVALTWRLPSESSTPRVTTWRTLRRMGAVLLTPGAAIVPFTEELLEQCEWLAQRIGESGGEAWVLPVSELSEREEAAIRERERASREREYGALRLQAEGFVSTRRKRKRLPSSRKLGALERGYSSVLARDHFKAEGRGSARRAIEEARRLRRT